MPIGSAITCFLALEKEAPPIIFHPWKEKKRMVTHLHEVGDDVEVRGLEVDVLLALLLALLLVIMRRVAMSMVMSVSMAVAVTVVAVDVGDCGGGLLQAAVGRHGGRAHRGVLRGHNKGEGEKKRKI
jgi:hypothetical protein